MSDFSNFAKPLNELANDLLAGRLSHLAGVERFSTIRIEISQHVCRFTDAKLHADPGSGVWKTAYRRASDVLDTMRRRDVQVFAERLENL